VRRIAFGLCSVKSKLRNELLDGEILEPLHEAQVLVARWRRHYNGEAWAPQWGRTVHWATVPPPRRRASPEPRAA